MTSRTTQFFMTREEAATLFTRIAEDLGLSIVGTLMDGCLGLVDLASLPIDQWQYERVYFSRDVPTPEQLVVGADKPHSLGWVRVTVPLEVDNSLTMSDIAYKAHEVVNPAHKLFVVLRRRLGKSVTFGGFITSASKGGRWPARNVGFSPGSLLAYYDGVRLVQYAGDDSLFIPADAV